MLKNLTLILSPETGKIVRFYNLKCNLTQNTILFPIHIEEGKLDPEIARSCDLTFNFDNLVFCDYWLVIFNGKIKTTL